MSLQDYPGFCDGTYRFPYSPLLGTDTCKNLWPLKLTPTSKGRVGFTLPPGKELATTFAKSPGRGVWSGDTPLIYAVSGDSLYSYDAILGTVVDRSALPGGVTVGNDGFPVMFASNGFSQLGLCSNGRLYVDSGTGPVLIATPADAGGVGALVFISGYGVIFEVDTNNVFVSAINDLTTWSVGDKQIWFATQDRLTMLSVDINNRLWLWGRKTIEPWQLIQNPGTGFPFGRTSIGGINTGLAARFGVGMVPQPQGSDQQVFLSVNERGSIGVYALQGYQTVRISNDAIEELLDNLSISDDCVLNGYWAPGHRQACLTFPDAELMVVYDFSTGLWHERYSAAWSAYIEPLGRFHVAPITVRIRNHFWLSGKTGKLYRDNPLLYQDEGNPIHWERIAPNINNALQAVTLATIALDVNVGEGASGTGISLEVSNDNGQTYGTARSKSTGANAAYNTEVRWDRAGGTSDTFVCRFRGNANRKLAIVAASIDADGNLGY